MALKYDHYNVDYQDALDNQMYKRKEIPICVSGELISNFPQFESPEPKRPDPVWFLDIGDETVARAGSLNDIKWQKKNLFKGKGEIRPYYPTIDELVEEDSERKAEVRYASGFGG